MIWFASTTVVPIRLSRTRVDHGEVAARGELRTFYRLTAPLIVAYCLFIAIFGELIMNVVYGDKFASYGWVLALAALFRIFLYHGHLISLGLRALEMARPIFIGLAAAVPFALVVGTALTVWIGILGAMISMFGATAIWTVVWARAYFGSAQSRTDRSRRRESLPGLRESEGDFEGRRIDRRVPVVGLPTRDRPAVLGVP